MRISIEQLLSGIGSNDNFVKAKDASSWLKDCFWNIMLKMLYLNAFSLPTMKEIDIQHKMRKQVMFWFTQDSLKNNFLIERKTVHRTALSFLSLLVISFAYYIFG